MANWDAKRDELEEIFNMTRKDIKESNVPFQLKTLRTYNQLHRFDSVDDYLASISNSWRRIDEKVRNKEPLPRMFFSIGTEDPGFERWTTWKAHAEEIGLDAEFITGPGQHEWRVWERDIQKAIEFFGLEDDVKGNIF